MLVPTDQNGFTPAEDERDEESEFDHFADLAAKLLAVPKAEVNGKAKRKRVTRKA